jgi:site-specific DNA recombinase
MRAVIYCRVSTEDQEREGTSLQSQLEACLKKAQELEYDVQEERILTEIFSGLMLDRPKLTQLREWVKRKEIDAVIVYSTDRLSRDPLHLLLLAEECDKNQISLIFVTEPLDNSMEGQLLGFVKGWASKLEALKIVERTTRGKLSRAKEGRQPCGRAPYGYRLVDGKHEIEPKEAEVVRMIFDWLVKERLSLNAIQMRLNKLGMPTRSGRQWWQRATLYRIVRDEAYTGHWFYNKRVEVPAKSKKGVKVQVLRPREQWIPVSISPLVSSENFEAAQRQLARNAELSPRNTKRHYLLSGLLVCGKCGYNWTGRTINGKTYYSCNSKLGSITPNACPSRYIRADKLEPVVWETISRLLSQPKLIIEQIKNRGQANSGIYLRTSLERVCQALGKKSVEADRMLDAYKIGAMDLQTLKRKMDEVKREEAKLTEEKFRLEGELRRAEAQELNEGKLYEFCQNLPTTLANLTFEDKRQILREVVDKVIVDEDKVTIYGIIPMPEDKVDDLSVVLPSS